MERSRLTFASTEAAAIAALRQSPSITARCSKPNSGTLNPSTRQTVPGTATPSSAVRRASRFVLWSPRLSMPRTQRDTITERAAAGLVGARDEPAAELTVEREQAPPVAGARPPPAAPALAGGGRLAATGPGWTRLRLRTRRLVVVRRPHVGADHRWGYGGSALHRGSPRRKADPTVLQ